MHPSNENAILLSDIFNYYKTKQVVRIDLCSNFIKFYNNPTSKETNQQVPDLILSIKDVAGSSIGKGHSKNDIKSYLTIYAYVRPSNSSNNSKTKRKRQIIELACSKYSTYDQNLSYVNKWHRELDNILKEKFISTNGSEDLNDSYLIKPFLVLVNTKAGAGKAKNIYYERVLPIFAESNTPDTLVFTQHQNFAREYIKNLKLEDYRGIIVISGDGLMHEVINGLMDRDDWQKAIKTPLGHIPGGSANALSCSVSYLTNEIYLNLSLESFASQSTFNITKSTVQPIDLVACELSNKKIIHSFLSLEWAIIADVDLESEKYRFLGGLRFVVGALMRIMNLRIYRGRLSFLPADECKDYKPKGSSIKLIRNEGNPRIENTISDRFKFKYLNPLDKPVPEGWITIEDNFVLFLAMYLPLISPDFLAAPDSTFNDGNIHLIFIKEGITKAQLLNLFNDTETGNHMKSDLVEYVKVKAFRLEPLPLQNTQSTNSQNVSGIMMVDGEQIPCGPLQAEIFPSMGNILANVKD